MFVIIIKKIKAAKEYTKIMRNLEIFHLGFFSRKQKDYFYN